MYILFNKETKKVEAKSAKPFSNYISIVPVEIAEYKGEIPKNDYLTVTNLREETETWTETKSVERLDENGEPIFNENGEVITEEIIEEKSRTYLACDLLANFYPPKTEEELALEKQKKYEILCEKYIREKYSASDEFKILRRYQKNPYDASNIENFNTYNEYVESCLAKAEAELNK